MTFAVPAPSGGNAKLLASTALTCAAGVAMVLLSSPVHARVAPEDATETPADAAGATSDTPADTTEVPAEADEAPASPEPPPPSAVEAEPEPEPEPEPVEEPDDESEPEPEPVEDAEAGAYQDDAPIRPPRFDGPYVGLTAYGTASFASVLDLDTPNPLIGASGFIQAGDAVFPWMSIGVTAGGGAGWSGDQQMFQGALLVEFGFAPLERYPFSIRAGFGFGGGAVSEPDVPRAGFGGALFKGSVRYEFFPLAERKRPTRGGGWAIGPELGWLGATPAGPGQPFVNTIILGLSTSFYFGS